MCKSRLEDLDVVRFGGAAREAGIDYEALPKEHAQTPLQATDAATGQPITDATRIARIWVWGHGKVCPNAAPEGTLATRVAGLVDENWQIREMAAVSAGLRLRVRTPTRALPALEANRNDTDPDGA